MASAYGPMTEELQAQREEAVEIAKRLAKLQKRNDTLSAELSEASTTLGTNRAMYDGVRSKLRDTRLELQAVRKNSNRFAMEDEAARKEIEDSEALISALASEMEALKAESPVLVAKRDMVAKELEEALGNVEVGWARATTANPTDGLPVPPTACQSHPCLRGPRSSSR